MNGTNLINDKRGARLMLGYLPQEFGLYPTLTATQMLDYFARLKGVSNRNERASLVEALLERVNLSQSRKQRLGEFSGGMRQRLGIAQALIGEPQLIIVDEPTAGLDPEERIRFHNLLAETASTDTVVLLSTHIVSDVSSLCSQMAIIRRGEILATIAPRHALNELNGCVWEANVEPQLVAPLKARMKVTSSQMSNGLARLRVISSERPTEDFHSATPTLEDYYLNLVSES